MSLLTRLRKHWRAGIATIIAGSMLAGGLTAAFADGGGVLTPVGVVGSSGGCNTAG